ncbi:MAG: hypothetical protein JWR90_3871 [Marmoricola sp.]|nr:hypothetical protein [Marmoricola sp.]
MNLQEQVQAIHRQQRHPVAPLEWARVQRLYAFCRARAIERIVATGGSAARHRRDLATLETMYAKARHHDDVVVGCAVTYFRTQALKDAHHADFLGEWI